LIRKAIPILVNGVQPAVNMAAEQKVQAAQEITVAKAMPLRVNLPKRDKMERIAAPWRPYRSIAAKSIPGFSQFEDVWAARAPLGWDVKDAEPVAAACVALLSDLFPATTGEMLHVDGGHHAMGA
jgi:enoyl-[acyl-carrier-protein] reductase (NADH)